MIEYIELTFENCDIVKIDRKHIGNFCMEGFETTIERLGCNLIGRTERYNTVFVEINKEADKVHYQLGDKSLKTTVFERIKMYNDITSVKIKWIDSDVLDEYVVRWGGDSDYENLYQTTWISEQGHCYIIISKEKLISNFVDLDKCNDEQAIKNHWDMLR